MECQECHERPATIHFTKIINGEKMEYHLCEICAKEKGEEMAGYNGFSIHNLLSGLLNYEQLIKSQEKQVTPTSEPKCPKCGLTYQEFTQLGKFGCDECYKTFSNHLNPILRKVHSGNTTHIGKIPNRVGSDLQVRKKLEQLKGQLQKLIETEEFEEAAEVRDQIRALENGRDD